MPAGRITIVDRELAPRASTFPCEIVTCQFADGSRRRFFCKYPGGYHDDAYGHRGGVGYEARVYRDVLAPLCMSTPKWHGTYVSAEAGDVWLILEYLEGAAWRSRAITRAAEWIGRFHAAGQAHLATGAGAFLNRYGAEYYAGWARRTASFATGELSRSYPWLASVCRCFDDFVPCLLAGEPTIIHGEYYPVNILLHQGVIHPVDWESAAVAAGEIDLAALTEGWPVDVVQQCESAYQLARWPNGAPAAFHCTLDAARLYLGFRWLGGPECTSREQALPRLEHLRRAAERLALI
jgi:hypothetical protein